jgi:putative nucleotidyltransferase with HDIG domain
MLIENEVSIYDFVAAISGTVDLVSPPINNHHKRVAYIAYNIALEMNLPNDEIQDIVLAALLHDIGAFSTEERKKIISFDTDMNKHAEIGYKLLKNFEPLSQIAVLIKYHHTVFEKSNHDIPIGSYIIHLADRLSLFFDEHDEILAQVPKVFEKISKKQSVFHPDAIAAFSRLAKLEHVWIETFSSSIGTAMIKRMEFTKEIIDLETLQGFAKIISQIIDFRSKFTSTHSSGVAAVAFELSAISGFSERECKQIEIAGYLHDLGKLSVSNDILEKNGSLNSEELNSIKKHTYYTYSVLINIRGLENIAVWAAYHHEKLNGNGYPFHIRAKDFSKLARIMAVADILTALAEDRPYRLGMDRESVEKILLSMAESGAIDKGIVDLTIRNFSRINEVRIKAQQEAQREYAVFHEFSERS